MKMTFLAGSFAAATLLCLVSVPSQADQIITETAVPAPAPVVTAPVVTQERTTTVAPAPVVTERQDSVTTTSTTHKLTHDEKEKLEKERELQKDIDKADRKRDEKVREAVKDARD